MNYVSWESRLVDCSSGFDSWFVFTLMDKKIWDVTSLVLVLLNQSVF